MLETYNSERAVKDAADGKRVIVLCEKRELASDLFADITEIVDDSDKDVRFRQHLRLVDIDSGYIRFVTSMDHLIGMRCDVGLLALSLDGALSRDVSLLQGCVIAGQCEEKSTPQQ